MDANAVFAASFQQAVTICVLLYAGCVTTFALLGVSAAALRHRGLSGAR